MNEVATRLGAAARAARLAVHLTQAEAAEDAGVAPEVYARVERGLSLPRAATLIRICGALRVSADTLLGLAPKPAASTLKPNGNGELHRLSRLLRGMNDRSLKLLRLLLFELKPNGGKP